MGLRKVQISQSVSELVLKYDPVEFVIQFSWLSVVLFSDFSSLILPHLHNYAFDHLGDVWFLNQAPSWLSLCLS